MLQSQTGRGDGKTVKLFYIQELEVQSDEMSSTGSMGMDAGTDSNRM